MDIHPAVSFAPTFPLGPPVHPQTAAGLLVIPTISALLS